MNVIKFEYEINFLDTTVYKVDKNCKQKGMSNQSTDKIIYTTN